MRRLDRHRGNDFSSYLAPSVGLHPAVSSIPHLDLILTIVAVLVALEGLLIADKYYRRKTERPAQLAAEMPAGYKLLAKKYYVDELYDAILVKPLFAFSHYVLGWVMDLPSRREQPGCLPALPIFTGMILQRWQSGNLRSYAAWLTAAAAVLLLFVLLAQGAIPMSGTFDTPDAPDGSGALRR